MSDRLDRATSIAGRLGDMYGKRRMLALSLGATTALRAGLAAALAILAGWGVPRCSTRPAPRRTEKWWLSAALPTGTSKPPQLEVSGRIRAVGEGVEGPRPGQDVTVLPTAHALLHEVGRLRAGETVLAHGAAGDIGTVAGQLVGAAPSRASASRPSPSARPRMADRA